MRDAYRVIVIARWSNGVIKSETVLVAKIENCDAEPSPTPTAIPQEYLLEVFSDVTCQGWLVWAETTPETDRIVILPQASGDFTIRQEFFTIEVRAFWAANIMLSEMIDIQEPEGCESDDLPTEPPPRSDKPNLKVLHNPEEQQKTSGKGRSADKA